MYTLFGDRCAEKSGATLLPVSNEGQRINDAISLQPIDVISYDNNINNALIMV